MTAAVDVVYSARQYDAGYGCEERILRNVTRYNFTLFHDPRQCDHTGNVNFHGGEPVGRYQRALGAALATHGDVEYGLVLKARTDLSFSKDVDLKEYQALRCRPSGTTRERPLADGERVPAGRRYLYAWDASVDPATF